MYGHETDSVFTDEEGANDHISFRAGSSNRICNRYEEPSFPLRKRVLSDPAIHHQQQYHRHYDHHQNEDSNSDLYVNLHENLSLHSRQASQQSFMRSQQSLNSRNSTGIQPQRGDTIYGSNSTLRKNTESPSKSQQNGTLRKRPVPTPRTILNVDKIDRLIRTYSQFVIDPNGPDDYCPVCNVHLDEPAQVDQPNDGDDLNSVVCLTSCQHKVHLACLKRCTPELSSCLKCPTCAAISGKTNLSCIHCIFPHLSLCNSRITQWRHANDRSINDVQSHTQRLTRIRGLPRHPNHLQYVQWCPRRETSLPGLTLLCHRLSQKRFFARYRTGQNCLKVVRKGL